MLTMLMMTMMMIVLTMTIKLMTMTMTMVMMVMLRDECNRASEYNCRSFNFNAARKECFLSAGLRTFLDCVLNIFADILENILIFLKIFKDTILDERIKVIINFTCIHPVYITPY